MMDKLNWRSPHEVPDIAGPGLARRVLVCVEVSGESVRRHLTWGHCIIKPNMPRPYPDDGWFFDGMAMGGRVVAWAYANPPTDEELMRFGGKADAH